MENSKMKLKVIFSFGLLVFSMSIFVLSTYAFFTYIHEEDYTAEFGKVDVELYAYFDDGQGGQIVAEEVVVQSSDEATSTDVSFVSSTSTIASTTIDLSVYSSGDKIRVSGSNNNDGIYVVTGTPTSNSLIVEETISDETAGNSITLDKVMTKSGVYFINIVAGTNDFFFEDFRIYLDIYSSIPTYFRVKIYEQLTLIYTDYQGQKKELSILSNEYMPFNYETTNWYDNRTLDNYIYYKLPVERVNASTPLEIDLISSYFTGQQFSVYSPGYSLQIAFSIEAVQSDGGPENVWGLSNKPWGGSW